MPYTTVRLARSEDRDTVLAFCANTWEWGDYIDRVWDDWLTDVDGLLLVATVDEQPVGVVHMRMLTENDAWLEGLRIDPAYRRQGLAKLLSEAVMLEAMRKEATHIRLMTEAENAAVIKLYQQMHMRQMGSLLPARAKVMEEPSKRQYGLEETHLATPADLDEIVDYLNASNVFPAVGGLYYVGFTAYVITEELISAKIAAQQLYLLRRWERLDGLAIAETWEGRQGTYLSIGYIDGTTIEAISLVAYDLHRRLLAMGLESAFAYVPDLVLVRDAFDGVGYESNGNTFYTYERGLV